MVHLTAQNHRRRLPTALAMGLLIVLGGISVFPAQRAAAQAVTRSGDPLAVTAVQALVALRAKGTGLVAVPAGDAAQPVTQPAAAPQNAVTGSAAVASSGVVTPTPPNGSNWSSYVVDTPSLGRPVTQVPTPVVPTEVTSPTTSTTVPPQTVVLTGSTDYAATRLALARLVASRVGVPAVDLDAVWAHTDDRRLVALFTALAQVGTPYRYTGKEPGGFDCSGLTSYSWGQAGVKIPRTSTDQINAAAPRSVGELQPGDLVWRSGHVMMYVGIGEIIVDSPQTGRAADVKKWGRVSRFGSPV